MLIFSTLHNCGITLSLFFLKVLSCAPTHIRRSSIKAACQIGPLTQFLCIFYQAYCTAPDNRKYYECTWSACLVKLSRLLSCCKWSTSWAKSNFNNDDGCFIFYRCLFVFPFCSYWTFFPLNQQTLIAWTRSWLEIMYSHLLVKQYTKMASLRTESQLSMGPTWLISDQL